MNWKLTKTDKCVLEVRCVYESVKDFYFLLTSDVHFDNPKCKRDLYFKHLNQAKKRNAGIFCFGDFFCLMQGRNDRRRNKGDIRPEHNTATYQDDVISDSASHLLDWKDNFIAFSDGNHETAVVKNIEVNPLANLCVRLNNEGANTFHLPYTGIIKFAFNRPDGGGVRKFVLAFHHGKWGGVVSKGVQSVARFSAMFPDADAIVSGHTHDTWVVPHVQYKLSKSGKLKKRTQWHLKTATYKDEFEHGSGFAVEKIVQPKPLGGLFMKLSPTGAGIDSSFEFAT